MRGATSNSSNRQPHAQTHLLSSTHTGSYALRVGQTSCVECRPGTYAESGTATGQNKDICTECEAGKWSSAGRSHHPCCIILLVLPADFTREKNSANL
jgi:hypothetical protein